MYLGIDPQNLTEIWRNLSGTRATQKKTVDRKKGHILLLQKEKAGDDLRCCYPGKSTLAPRKCHRNLDCYRVTVAKGQPWAPFTAWRRVYLQVNRVCVFVGARGPTTNRPKMTKNWIKFDPEFCRNKYRNRNRNRNPEISLKNVIVVANSSAALKSFWSGYMICQTQQTLLLRRGCTLIVM